MRHTVLSTARRLLGQRGGFFFLSAPPPSNTGAVWSAMGKRGHADLIETSRLKERQGHWQGQEGTRQRLSFDEDDTREKNGSLLEIQGWGVEHSLLFSANHAVLHVPNPTPEAGVVSCPEINGGILSLWFVISLCVFVSLCECFCVFLNILM